MNLFEFKDYRAYLKQHIRKLPKGGRGEINRMAEHLSVHSSLVSQILSGAKDFNVEQAQEIAAYLQLTPLETDYFLLLIQWARAGTHKLKTYFQEKINQIRNDSLEISRRIPQDRVLTEIERSVFYSSWVYLAIWLFTSVGKGQTLVDIARRFEITRTRAVDITNFLLQAQLCKREGERFVMGPQRTHLDRESPFLVKHHINWRVKAMQRSEDLEAQEMMFTSPISISREDFAILREQMVEFIKAASDRVAKSAAEDLACLNLDLFWIRK